MRNVKSGGPDGPPLFGMKKIGIPPAVHPPMARRAGTAAETARSGERGPSGKGARWLRRFADAAPGGDCNRKKMEFLSGWFRAGSERRAAFAAATGAIAPVARASGCTVAVLRGILP
jgi:hypothetical protein